MKFSKLIILQSSLFISYLISSVFLIETSGYIALTFTLSAAGIVFFCASKMTSSKVNWYLLGAMVMTWTLAEALLLLAQHIGIDTNDGGYMIVYVYLLSNMFLLLAILSFFFERLSRYNLSQVIADSVMIALIVLGIGSGVYLWDIDYYTMPVLGIVGGALYMTTDFFALILLLVNLSSTRNRHISRVQLSVSVALIIHFFADGHIISNFFLKGQLSSVSSNVLLMLSFLVISLTALTKISLPEKEKHSKILEAQDNMGKPIIIFIIASMPFVFYAIDFIDKVHLLAMSVVLILYFSFNAVLQKELATALLLKQEINNKNTLKEKVSLRTQELEAANERLKNEVTSDALTGLYNRRYFMTLVGHKIDVKKQPFTILFIDLNRFKTINDLHGHAMGDNVLSVVAARFKARQSAKFTFARFGGDEFAVAMDETDLEVLKLVAEEVADFIMEPIKVGDYTFNVEASIGIARYPEDATDISELLKYADIAMYRAKKHDKTTPYVMHSDIFAKGFERRNYIELLLKTADFANDFTLHYQPQFVTESEELMGMEALIRWQHPTLGFISPAEFIPICEEIGLINQMTDWVFMTAMKQINEWNLRYESNMIMSMNVSAMSLDNGLFVPKIIQMIDETGVRPEWLAFEITEHSAIATIGQMEEFISALCKIGVEIAIDDFGTGYSSLSYLKRFKMDVLKIAKELIDNIESDPDERLIIQAIIMLAKGLGMRTVAEGVEEQGQLKILTDLGCDIIQGYCWGKPVSYQEFETLFLGSWGRAS